MSADSECVFCQIVAGQIPAEVVWQNEHAVAFRDLNPQAPTHVLVVPSQHVADFGSLAAEDPQALTALIEAAAAVAAQEGIAGGYRLVFNTGAAAGQSVFHCHGHVLGGRRMSWPPG